MFTKLNDFVISKIEEMGYKAAVCKEATKFSKDILKSKWSHRHIAKVAGLGTFGLNNIDIKLSAYPVVFSKHIFSFMFINSMAYAPGLGVGVMFDRDLNHYYTVNLDLIHLYDTQYVYDFFYYILFFIRDIFCTK